MVVQPVFRIAPRLLESSAMNVMKLKNSFCKRAPHFHFENYVTGPVWKRSTGKQRKLLKFQLEIVSLSSPTANTLDGGKSSAMASYCKIGSVVKFTIYQMLTQNCFCTTTIGKSWVTSGLHTMCM